MAENVLVQPQPLPVFRAVRTVARITVPSPRLLSEMSQVVLVVWMQHLLVSYRHAHIGEVLEEILVSAFQKVDLRVEQVRVSGFVFLAILLAKVTVSENGNHR